MKKVFIALLACAVLNGCATLGTPQKLEDATGSLDSYTSQKGRDLAVKYKANLENIFNMVEAKYSPSEVAFMK